MLHQCYWRSHWTNFVNSDIHLTCANVSWLTIWLINTYATNNQNLVEVLEVTGSISIGLDFWWRVAPHSSQIDITSHQRKKTSDTEVKPILKKYSSWKSVKLTEARSKAIEITVVFAHLRMKYRQTLLRKKNNICKNKKYVHG